MQGGSLGRQSRRQRPRIGCLSNPCVNSTSPAYRLERRTYWETGMSPKLDHLLAKLNQQSLDRDLGGITAGIGEQLSERAKIDGQTWRLRTAAMALLVMGGAAVSASTASAVAPSPSPFAAWSSLAPSTLLEPSE